MDICQTIMEKGLLADVEVAGALGDMFAKYGNMHRACELFDEMPGRNVVSWTTMIPGYAEDGFVETALEPFKQIQLAGLKSHSTTFAAIFLACVKIGELEQRAVHRWRRQMTILHKRIKDLESSLQTALQNRQAERKGRIRAQQELRNALTEKTGVDTKFTSYPMTPIGIIQSCFSTRNGTPRQPLLVPSARACLILYSGGIPLASLEGLGEYSHCWILYVFHMNTDLSRLWEQPAHSNFKAKVRVPRLQGGKKGVLATRSPHRPCPIGLTVAK
ncbi:hypothetical protein KI387_008710, partial [Taxus chinensis]